MQITIKHSGVAHHNVKAPVGVDENVKTDATRRRIFNGDELLLNM